MDDDDDDDNDAGRGRLRVGAGNVKEVGTRKEMSAYLAECGLLRWWMESMGFNQGGGGVSASSTATANTV